MNEIEHEGKTYILKSQMESIIKERVGKVLGVWTSEPKSHIWGDIRDPVHQLSKPNTMSIPKFEVFGKTLRVDMLAVSRSIPTLVFEVVITIHILAQKCDIFDP